MREEQSGPVSADDVVDAYHRFRRADGDLHARVRAATGMSDNELRVLQYLLTARQDGRSVMPREITHHLGISSASTTALLDRLERGGTLQRVSNPADRRSVHIAPTETAETTLSSTLHEYESRLRELAQSLPTEELDAIRAFLNSMTDAAGDIATTGGHS